MMKLKILAIGILLGGCDMGHLGNPLMWPVNAVGSAVENSVYSARRNRVKTYISTHYSALILELKATAGPIFLETARLAGVPQSRIAKLYDESRSDLTRLTADIAQNVEKLTVTYMVYGG